MQALNSVKKRAGLEFCQKEKQALNYVKKESRL